MIQKQDRMGSHKTRFTHGLHVSSLEGNANRVLKSVVEEPKPFAQSGPSWNLAIRKAARYGAHLSRRKTGVSRDHHHNVHETACIL